LGTESGGLGELKAVDDSLPVEFRFLEVHEQAGIEAGRSKIVEALRSVLGGETVCALQFDQNQILDENIGEVLAYGEAFIGDFKWSVMDGRDASESKFSEQGANVDLF
jgi:hypothetical protein